MESMCHVTIVVTPCRQLLYISVPAVAQVSHVQPQRSKSEFPVLWPQLCLAAQWHRLWWPGETSGMTCLLHMCMDRRMLQVHVLLRITSVRHLQQQILCPSQNQQTLQVKHGFVLFSTCSVEVPRAVLRDVGTAQVGYWSLFVDGLFENGMSHKGATYTNPVSLSADTKFEVTAPGYASLQPSPAGLAAAQTHKTA